MLDFTALGDSALIVRVGRGSVLRSLRQIERAEIRGVVEVAPAYTTIGVFFNPSAITDGGVEPEEVNGWLEAKIREALARRIRRNEAASRRLDVPVCFDSEFAPDLGEVAAKAAMSPEQVVDLYCATEYEVACIGFTPGFPYLDGLPEKLATPRRAEPRTEVPAGSVAIGGNQTGVYPLASPGGWNIVGRSPLSLFDPQSNPPAFFAAGDRVCFRAISRDEFARTST